MCSTTLSSWSGFGVDALLLYLSSLRERGRDQYVVASWRSHVCPERLLWFEIRHELLRLYPVTAALQDPSPLSNWAWSAYSERSVDFGAVSGAVGVAQANACGTSLAPCSFTGNLGAQKYIFFVRPIKFRLSSFFVGFEIKELPIHVICVLFVSRHLLDFLTSAAGPATCNVTFAILCFARSIAWTGSGVYICAAPTHPSTRCMFFLHPQGLLASRRTPLRSSHKRRSFVSHLLFEQTNFPDLGFVARWPSPICTLVHARLSRLVGLQAIPRPSDSTSPKSLEIREGSLRASGSFPHKFSRLLSIGSRALVPPPQRLAGVGRRREIQDREAAPSNFESATSNTFMSSSSLLFLLTFPPAPLCSSLHPSPPQSLVATRVASPCW